MPLIGAVLASSHWEQSIQEIVVEKNIQFSKQKVHTLTAELNLIIVVRTKQKQRLYVLNYQ